VPEERPEEHLKRPPEFKQYDDYFGPELDFSQDEVENLEATLIKRDIRRRRIHEAFRSLGVAIGPTKGKEWGPLAHAHYYVIIFAFLKKYGRPDNPEAPAFKMSAHTIETLLDCVEDKIIAAERSYNTRKGKFITYCKRAIKWGFADGWKKIKKEQSTRLTLNENTPSWADLTGRPELVAERHDEEKAEQMMVQIARVFMRYLRREVLNSNWLKFYKEVFFLSLRGWQKGERALTDKEIAERLKVLTKSGKPWYQLITQVKEEITQQIGPFCKRVLENPGFQHEIVDIAPDRDDIQDLLKAAAFTGDEQELLVLYRKGRAANR
jgi:hypothetical protein